ncbi:hypothetical protein [Mitsuaria sp. GD03876]|uniref:hypothetical protein n=1 Tax=Mitsuaria sp. GD03876 TaxID=2975399 RepID=UPI002448374A|nr:hypothetical protein [Mitsuaria sp. GD03876]MDH0865346.1 hypothetical protein [Mitsuaria sp. GD03876]
MKPLHRLPFALLAVASAPCWAQSDVGSPWYLGASLGHYYSSNVFRSSGGANSDQLTSISLLGGVDQRLGRQRVYANARLNDTRYQDNSRLNNNGYNLGAGVNWETVGNLSGTVEYTRARTLADFNSTTAVAPTTERNLQTDQSATATARLGLPTMSSYAIEASWIHRERAYSLQVFDSQEYRQDQQSLGLLYNASSAWRFGVAGRYTKGKVPVGGFEYDRKDLDLTALWRATGSSSLNARLSRSRSDNFSGLTGALNWDWRPGGRWSASTQLSRDTGIETYYQGINNGISDFNRVQTAFQTQLNYQLTGKVTVQLGAGYTRLNRRDDQVGTSFKDNSKQYSLGLAWQALRNVTVGCQYSHLSRDTTNVLYAYSAYTAGCYVQGMIR